MSFELNIDFEKELSRPPPMNEITIIREMVEADLALINATPTGYAPPQLIRITERHHALARALALGLSPGVAAARCGYSQSFVSVLQQNPAFLDLVEIYRKEVNMQFVDHAEQLAGLATDAVLVIRDRLEADPDAFGTKTLVEIATAMGDRAGYGPIKRTENVNVNVSLGEKLAAARRRVAEMKDITPNANE